MGSGNKRVNSSEILGEHVSDDRSYMEHSHRLPVQEGKQMPICTAHSQELKSGVAIDDFVKIFCALIRCVLEYASSVWATLPEYHYNVIERVQRKALRIMLPDLSHGEALHRTSLQSLSEGRAEACCKFLLQSQHQEPMKSVLYRDTIQHDYNLRPGRSQSLTPKLNKKRFSEFVTIKFSDCIM